MEIESAMLSADDRSMNICLIPVPRPGSGGPTRTERPSAEGRVALHALAGWMGAGLSLRREAPGDGSSSHHGFSGLRKRRPIDSRHRSNARIRGLMSATPS